MTNHKRFIMKRNIVISLMLSAILLLSMPVSAFATTISNTCGSDKNLSSIQTGRTASPSESETKDSTGFSYEQNIINDGTDLSGVKSNRYYYTISTVSSTPISRTITKAEAKSIKALDSVLKTLIGTAVAGIFIEGGAVVAGLAFNLATDFLNNTEIVAGKYTGRVYHVIKYKVDSLTGKKTKYKDGVRVKLSHGDVSFTRTSWCSK